MPLSHIPSLFLWFPLLGTENFGVNFIFHSKRFYPVEKRNNIMLPGSTFMKHENGGKNSEVLKEMSEVLFAYYKNEENAKTLNREMCEVSFPMTNEDDETRKFYEEMQCLWNTQIPDWKILPVNGDYYAVSDSNVKLLHRDFYFRLNEGQRVEYETILEKYAQFPKKVDEQPYLFPSKDLIAWSEMVDRWDCKRDDEFFITVADVCQAIKTKNDELHSFLKLMKDSGNASVMKEYALLPNREGDLRKQNELYNAAFMSPNVYELVKDVMGDDSKKIYDSTYIDVCEVNEYSRSDLQRAISSTMSDWRSSTLKREPKIPLAEEKLKALIKFCSASNTSEFNNARGKMMPLLADFYEIPFKVVDTIKFKEEKEEDFYRPAFDLLLEYTLYQLSLKDEKWVKEHKSWLKSFLLQYGAKTNEERRKRLDEYGVLPNQNGKLCLMSDLHKNAGVPTHMAAIYKTIFGPGSDLYDSWVDLDFEDLVELTTDEPKDIAKKIEEVLVSDMKKEIKERKFQKVVRSIILELSRNKEWEEWFGQINDKKATYTFSMQKGSVQESLFTLMDIDEKDLARLAKLSEDGSIGQMLEKVEHLQELEQENIARFEHMHAIGKHIESLLREEIGKGLVCVKKPETAGANIQTEDVQNGQDIIVSVQKGNEWKDVFYVEVKSKWDFMEPAHMSTSQVRKAAQYPDKYALCCVDLRKHKSENIRQLPIETIIECTKVRMDIGDLLNPMFKGILEADHCNNDGQITISEYRSNMGATFFERGEPFDVLMNAIRNKIYTECNHSN